MGKKIFCVALCLIALFAEAVAAADSPLDALRAYYEADKKEDVSALMELTDFSHVEQSERAAFEAEARETAELLNRIFDTEGYSISGERVLETRNGSDAVVFYHLNATLKDADGKRASIDSDYVAVMHAEGGEWRIVYVQPKASFEQALLLREAAVSAGTSVKEIFVGTEENVAATPPGGGGKNGTEPPPDTEFIDTLIIAVVGLIILVAIIIVGKIVFRGPGKGGTQKSGEAEKPAEAGGARASGQQSLTKKEYTEAMKILRERYAKGDISTEEFKQRKKELEE